MILLIDNYDSFTYNLYHYLSALKCKVEIFRNDKIKANDLKKRNYKHLRTPISLAVMLVITIFLIDQGALNYAVYGQR